jgi:hypothetical protein
MVPINKRANHTVLSQNKSIMSDLTGCKKESADMNNIIEEQILKPCKTIKTENFFKCDEEYSLNNMRLHTEDGL